MVVKRFLTLWTVIVLACLTQRTAAASYIIIEDDLTTTTAAIGQEDRTDKDQEKKKKKREADKEGNEKGTLGTFESEATGENPDSVYYEETDESGGWGWYFMGKVAEYAFIAGAIGSWYRVTGAPVDGDLEQYFGERQTGDPGIPYIGLNFSYQNLKSDVEAADVNAEGGFGPLGVHYRFTRFKEKDPEYELDLSWLHGVLRLSYTRYLEVGLGFGAIFLEGTGSESGFSFELPIRIEPSRYFGFDYRPTWGWINGNTVGDHDLALRLGTRYVSIRGGYRWTKTGNSTLEGPLIGLLLTY